MRGPECSTDHYLVRCQLRMKITLPRWKTPASTKLKKLDISKLANPEHCRDLTRAIQAALESVQSAGEEVEQHWKALKEAVYSASRKTLGHPHRKTPDWFWEHGKEIERLLEEKKSKHLRHLQENSKRSKSALAEVKAKVQREVRILKNGWWQRRAEELQSMADNHNYRGLFAGLKAIYGPKNNAVAPVKTADGSKLLTDLQDIRARWKEHFNNLLNQERSAHPDACKQLKRKPTRNELRGEITMEELKRALKSTAPGKAPGLDGVSSDILKNGGEKMCEALLDLFNRYLLSETVPQDFRDALIVTVYKRKGDRAECGNHRGISLLAIAGKVLAKIVLNRLKFISEEVLLESQCGFWQDHSTSDTFFTLRQLQEKAVEQHQPLYIVFVDFTKAFDTTDRTTLWKILEIYGCPEKLVNIIKQFHCEMKAQVSVGGEPSDAFEVNHGMKQGCVLDTTLFSLYLTAVLETMDEGLNRGVFIRTRADGKLFNTGDVHQRTALC